MLRSSLLRPRANGRKTGVTNALNKTTTYTYDRQGRVLTETAPNNGVISYSYDVAGNLRSLNDPDNYATTYSYNAIHQMVSMTNAMGYQSTYAYNAAGLLTSTTDADGCTITYGYDAIGERTSETWVSGSYTATYTYNAAGQLTEATDPNSTYTYTYDNSGRETSVSNAGTPGVPAVTLTYTYDDYGNRTSLQDSLGGQISYSYDNDLRMTMLSLYTTSNHTLLLDASVNYSYNGGSLVTSLSMTATGGSTITSSLSYDKVNELTNLTDTVGTTTLANYTYGYNAASQLTSYQDNNSSSLTYGYDANGELTNATGTLNGSTYAVTYSYDANGNRTMTGYTTGHGNELTSDGIYNYTYDNNGNTLTQTQIATGTVTNYTWDYRNRLTEVKVETSGGTVLNDEKFTYDVNNNRIAVSLNGTTQLYTVYDGANPYMDFNGSGTLTERYLTNPKALSQFYGQVNGSGTVQWFLTDNINSIRQVINASGSVLDAITYDPFGNISSQTNSANMPRFLYTGGAYDSVSGNYQFDARYYHPTAGRFVSQDPSGFSAHDSNLYRYVFNVPTMSIDPAGLQAPPNWSNGTISYDYAVSILKNSFSGSKLSQAIFLLQDNSNVLALFKPGHPGSDESNEGGFWDVIGKILGLPNTIIGLGFGEIGDLYNYVVGNPSNIFGGHNAIQFTNSPFISGNGALTLGNVILYGTNPNDLQENGVPIGSHEEQHTYQSQVLGLFYFPFHGLAGFGSSLTTHDWHEGNPLEHGPMSNPPNPWFPPPPPEPPVASDDLGLA